MLLSFLDHSNQHLPGTIVYLSKQYLHYVFWEVRWRWISCWLCLYTLPVVTIMLMFRLCFCFHRSYVEFIFLPITIINNRGICLSVSSSMSIMFVGWSWLRDFLSRTWMSQIEWMWKNKNIFRVNLCLFSMFLLSNMVIKDIRRFYFYHTWFSIKCFLRRKKRLILLYLNEIKFFGDAIWTWKAVLRWIISKRVKNWNSAPCPLC